MKGRPFTLLGVNSDPDQAALGDQSRRQGINWRSWWDGDVNGPVGRAWEVQGLPYLFILDPSGKICDVNLFGPDLDRAADELVSQAIANTTAGQ
jgi:hypothetical protein